MKKTTVTILAALLMAAPLSAQVPLVRPGVWLTKISPRYFGPYAFPVADCNKGLVDSCIRAELAFDYVSGDMGDKTFAPTFKVNFPLWTDRAAVTVGGEFQEWFEDTAESFAFRRISNKYPLKGNGCGNIYFSIDIQALKERKYVPSLAFRAIVLTAAGGNFERARHYDAPGYAFDLTAGKDLFLTRNRLHKIRVAAGLGFVCWQIDRATQNDALLVNTALEYSYSRFSIEASYGQYTGRIWHHEPDEGDKVQSFKLRTGWRIGVFTPFIYFQKGINDWPFTQFRAGLSLSLPRLGSR